jgi:hypothetical protein
MWSKRPSSALVVAMIAMFVALGGTAGAVATQAVPLAKRALSADNAKKLGGSTKAQLVAQAAARGAQTPGPASAAGGLVTIKAQTAQLPANGEQLFGVSCDGGQKVLGGGFSTNEVVFGLDSFPSSASTWSVYLANGSTTAPANIALYATCIR